MSFKVKLEIFEGPLDLLLYLVKKQQVSIYDVSIAKIADEYMRYLEIMRLLDLKIAGEFLVVASTLMQIKSRMLLPQLNENLEEEEQLQQQKEEFIEQILEYERFKQIAEELRLRQLQRQQVFTRPATVDEELKRKSQKERYFEASLFDLLGAFCEVLKDIPVELFYEAIKDEFTVEEKIHQILHLLVRQEVIHLSEFFKQAKNKMEIIVTFLAVLELIRLKEIKVVQERLFGEIQIIRNNNNIVPVGYGREKN